VLTKRYVNVKTDRITHKNLINDFEAETQVSASIWKVYEKIGKITLSPSVPIYYNIFTNLSSFCSNYFSHIFFILY
jgi:hypothetical protein